MGESYQRGSKTCLGRKVGTGDKLHLGFWDALLHIIIHIIILDQDKEVVIINLIGFYWAIIKLNREVSRVLWDVIIVCGRSLEIQHFSQSSFREPSLFLLLCLLFLASHKTRLCFNWLCSASESLRF